MRNRKTAVILAIALLVALAGCGGTAGTDDVPSDSIEEFQAPSETPETAPEETAGTAPDPAQSEGPTEAAREPAESSPVENEKPSAEPTRQPEQTAPTAAPASSAPSSAPTPTPAPAHTHSYTSAVTKEATCKAEGVRTYTCFCGDSYTEKISKTDSHSWATRHIDEVFHYESSGTHKVTYYTCDCGFSINSDDRSYIEIWKDHKNPITGCRLNYAYIVKDVPNSDSQYVVDTPAHDETYCTICGTVK